MLVPTVRTDKRVVEGADPYGETWVSAVGAGVLDSPAGKSEKMQKSPANADFDPFSPEISFLYFLAWEGLKD